VIVVLMGAAGAGKTTVGTALASALGWPFLDADDLHSPEHVEKMRRGVALTDEDRAPWLERVHDRIEQMARHGGNAVVACSGLRQTYRDTIAARVPAVRWVLLRAGARLLTERLRARTGHFAGPALVPSQLAELDPPDDGVVVEADRPVATLVAEIRAALNI
jgi:gluconokinase